MNAKMPARTCRNIHYTPKRLLSTIAVKALIILWVKSHYSSLLLLLVALGLCINGSMFFSHVMITDILLSEISLCRSIVREMLGYNPLCLRETQREVREGKEGVTETQAKS